MIKELKGKKILFVCAYGQSRSRYFAEWLNTHGIISNFSGWHKEADIVVNKNLLDSYDLIVLLDSHWFNNEMLSFYYSENENKFIGLFIDDRPREFRIVKNKLYLRIKRFFEDMKK